MMGSLQNLVMSGVMMAVAVVACMAHRLACEQWVVVDESVPLVDGDSSSSVGSLGSCGALGAAAPCRVESDEVLWWSGRALVDVGGGGVGSRGAVSWSVSVGSGGWVGEGVLSGV